MLREECLDAFITKYLGAEFKTSMCLLNRLLLQNNAGDSYVFQQG